jgi:hypothetical protein
MRLSPGTRIGPYEVVTLVGTGGMGEVYRVLDPRLGPDSDIGTWWMGVCRAAWRVDRAEVLRLAAGPYRQAAAWDAEIPWLLASAHAAVDARDEARFWLDRAIERGMINYPFLALFDRNLDPIRGDARSAAAMDRVRREWERFDRAS